MTHDSSAHELLALNQRLLDCIAQCDWKTYTQFCASSLTCIEPESQGQLVEGLAFHEFYFKLGAAQEPHCTTMASPNVRILGDTAIVAYVRLNQRTTSDGVAVAAFSETRIWHRENGRWVHVHFHRSQL